MCAWIKVIRRCADQSILNGPSDPSWDPGPLVSQDSPPGNRVTNWPARGGCPGVTPPGRPTQFSIQLFAGNSAVAVCAKKSLGFPREIWAGQWTAKDEGPGVITGDSIFENARLELWSLTRISNSESKHKKLCESAPPTSPGQTGRSVSKFGDPLPDTSGYGR